MRFERESAGWFARGKVDQIMPQKLALDQTHSNLPTTGEAPQFS
jgi:hypothetical protein